MGMELKEENGRGVDFTAPPEASSSTEVGVEKAPEVNNDTSKPEASSRTSSSSTSSRRADVNNRLAEDERSKAKAREQAASSSARNGSSSSMPGASRMSSSRMSSSSINSSSTPRNSSTRGSVVKQLVDDEMIKEREKAAQDEAVSSTSCSEDEMKSNEEEVTAVTAIASSSTSCSEDETKSNEEEVTEIASPCVESAPLVPLVKVSTTVTSPSSNATPSSKASNTSAFSYSPRRTSKAVEVDMDKLEAEYKKKAEDKLPVADKIGSEEEINAINRRRCAIRLCCPLVLVAIVLAIVLPLTTNPDPVTNAPTIAPTEQSEYDYLANLLEPFSGEKMYEEGTPQYQAFQWLLNEVPAMIDIKNPAEASNLVNRYSLATLYYSTDGPNWNDQLNFLSDSSVCDWHVERNGIMCTEDSNVPYYLRFSGNGLNGTIPSEVAAISTLTVFNVNNDRTLAGTIPPELGLLTQLETFVVAVASVSGTVPSTFDNLLSLKLLSLWSVEFTGPLPRLLELDHSLTGAYFDYNDFTGTIPSFKRGSWLAQFTCEGNSRLSGTIPESIYEQRLMSWIDLSDTKITGSIASEINQLTDLEEASFVGAQLTGQLPSTIGDLAEKLRWLRLSDNELSGTIPSQFGLLDRIEILHLDGNNLSGTIPSEMTNMPELRELWLGRNSRLEGTIPEGFVEMQELEDITIEGTRISGNYVNDTYCQLPALKTAISSNCAGDTPEIPCDCCISCCESNGEDDCELNLVGACSVNAGIATVEERDNTCSCSEDSSTYTCVETCQVCNFDGTVCAQTMGYGYEMNTTTGENIKFENSYEYTLGYEDTVVSFVNDVSDPSHTNTCRVFVNGEECKSCLEVNCGGNVGFENGYNIDCDNIGAGTVAHCDPLAHPPGPLDVFRFLNGAFTNDTVCLPVFPWGQDMFPSL